MNSGQPPDERRSTSGEIAGTEILEVDAAAEGPLERARYPIAAESDLLEHDVRRPGVQVRKTLLWPVVEDLETGTGCTRS